MENKPIRIDITMLDGSPEGILKCNEYNWAGVVYKALLQNIKFVCEENISGKKGFYIIFLCKADSEEKFYYIGQSKYYNSGDFNLYLTNQNILLNGYIIDSAVIIQKKDDTINDAEFNYMRSVFESKIDIFKNYVSLSESLKNIDDLKEIKKDELRNFVLKSITIIKCLGYNAFYQSKKKILENESYRLECSRHGQNTKIIANAIVKDNKFIILADSIAAGNILQSLPKKAKIERRRRAKKYMANYSDYKKFIMDKEFDEIKFATQVLLGTTRDWRDLWVSLDGKTIGEKYPNDLDGIKISNKDEPPKRVVEGNNKIKFAPKISEKTQKADIISKDSCHYKNSNIKMDKSHKDDFPKPQKIIPITSYNMDVTGKKPLKLIIDDLTYDVNNWAHMRFELLNFLYVFDKKRFENLLNENYYYLKLSRKSTQLIRPELFKNGIYVETCMNANSGLKFMYNLCKSFEIEQFVFYVLNE